MKKKYKSPLNGRGNAALIAAPTLFGITEALFHANPLVGGAVGVLASAIAYRHYEDVTAKVEVVLLPTLWQKSAQYASKGKRHNILHGPSLS